MAVEAKNISKSCLIFKIHSQKDSFLKIEILFSFSHKVRTFEVLLEGSMVRFGKKKKKKRF